MSLNTLNVNSSDNNSVISFNKLSIEEELKVCSDFYKNFGSAKGYFDKAKDIDKAGIFTDECDS